MDVTFLLSQSQFFKGLSPENQKALASICISKTYQKREVIFHEGDNAHSVYLLASGNIQLYKISPDGREIVIKILKPGELFAEVILFEEKKYPVNAVPLRKSQVYLLPKMQFFCLLENHFFRNDFISMLMKKMRYLTDQIYQLTAFDVETRFWRFLEEQYGRREEYKITLSKKDIASAIGTVPETFSRMLFRLKKEGKASLEGMRLTLKKGFWAQSPL
jgi:CRP/FNR family transcriptional regulator